MEKPDNTNYLRIHKRDCLRYTLCTHSIYLFIMPMLANLKANQVLLSEKKLKIKWVQ